MSLLIENFIYLKHSLPSIFSKTSYEKDEYNKKKKKKKKTKDSTWTLPFLGKTKMKKKKKDERLVDDSDEQEEEEIKITVGVADTDYGPPYYTEENPDGILDLCETCSKYPIQILQVHLLLNERVDPNLYDPNDSMLYTPMHWAARDYNVPVMKMLRLAKAAINPMSMLYQTPLVIACLVKQRPGTKRRKNQVKCIEFLLERNAFVNTRDKAGLTCLDYAAMNDDVEIVKLLLDAGAKTRHKNQIFTVQQDSILELMKSAESYVVPGLRAETIEELKKENDQFEDRMMEYQKYNHMNYDESSYASSSEENYSLHQSQQNQPNKTGQPNNPGILPPITLLDTNIQDDITSLLPEQGADDYINEPQKKSKSRCYKLINTKVLEQDQEMAVKKKIEDEALERLEAIRKRAEREEQRIENNRLKELNKLKKQSNILKSKSDHRKQATSNRKSDVYGAVSPPLNTDMVLKLNINKRLGKGTTDAHSADTTMEANRNNNGDENLITTHHKDNDINENNNILPLDPRVFKPTADAVKATELVGWSQCRDATTGASQWKEIQGYKNKSTMLKTYSMNEKSSSTSSLSHHQSLVFDDGFTHTLNLATKEMDILRAKERGARDESVCNKWQEFTGKNIEFLSMKNKKY